MAIAYVNSAVLFNSASQGTSGSTSYTIGSNANTGLLFWAMTNQSNGDVLTSITVAGVEATRVRVMTTGNQNIRLYIYRFENPPSGSQTIAFTTSQGNEFYLAVTEYSGVDISGMVGNTAQLTNQASPLTLSVTTTKDASWLASHARGTDVQPVASTGSTLRVNNFNLNVGDSNGAKSPIGSYSMAWTVSSGQIGGHIVEILAAASTPLFTLLGVGT